MGGVASRPLGRGKIIVTKFRISHESRRLLFITTMYLAEISGEKASSFSSGMRLAYPPRYHTMHTRFWFCMEGEIVGFVLGAIFAIGSLPLVLAILLQHLRGPEIGWSAGLFTFLCALWLLTTWTRRQAASTRTDA